MFRSAWGVRGGGHPVLLAGLSALPFLAFSSLSTSSPVTVLSVTLFPGLPTCQSWALDVSARLSAVTLPQGFALVVASAMGYKASSDGALVEDARLPDPPPPQVTAPVSS